jgi:hypothetical protein
MLFLMACVKPSSNKDFLLVTQNGLYKGYEFEFFENRIEDDSVELSAVEDPPSCFTAPFEGSIELDDVNLLIETNKSPRIYLELEYDFFKYFGTVDKATNYVKSAFDVVIERYANQGIKLRVSEIFVWTKQDPYPNTSTINALNKFRQDRPKGSFNGDVGLLLALPDKVSGGVAWVNGNCTDYAKGFCQLKKTFSTDSYSWTVMVMAHELGHVLGSPHTQSCSWPQGAIDGCVSSEGSCDNGPLPSGGGTIMSYCHVTSYGINFDKGFHPTVLAQLKSRIAAADCYTEVVEEPEDPEDPEDPEEPQDPNDPISICTVTPNPKYEWITSVSMGDYYRASLKEGFSSNGDVKVPGEVDIKVTIGKSSNWSDVLGFYVDWNNDGVYTTDESIWVSPTTKDYSFSFKAKFKKEGRYNSRFIISYSKARLPNCSSGAYEIEEYTLQIGDVVKPPDPPEEPEPEAPVIKYEISGNVLIVTTVGETTKVEFYKGGELVSTQTESPYSYNLLGICNAPVGMVAYNKDKTDEKSITPKVIWNE